MLSQRLHRYNASLNVTKQFCSLLDDVDEDFYIAAITHLKEMVAVANDRIIFRRKRRDNSNAAML